MKREHRPIFTYIIKSGNHYTIGKTIDIKDRICGYLTHNPDIILIDLFEGNHEPELHSRFEEHRVFPNTKREWFYLTPELIDTIDVQGLEQKYRNQVKEELEDLERQFEIFQSQDNWLKKIDQEYYESLKILSFKKLLEKGWFYNIYNDAIETILNDLCDNHRKGIINIKNLARS